MVQLSYSSHIPNPIIKDHYAILGNCPPTHPQANINTHFSLKANVSLRGGVGGQIPRNVGDILTEENANFCPSYRFRPGVLGL